MTERSFFTGPFATLKSLTDDDFRRVCHDSLNYWANTVKRRRGRICTNNRDALLEGKATTQIFELPPEWRERAYGLLVLRAHTLHACLFPMLLPLAWSDRETRNKVRRCRACSHARLFFTRLCFFLDCLPQSSLGEVPSKSRTARRGSRSGGLPAWLACGKARKNKRNPNFFLAWLHARHRRISIANCDALRVL